MGRFTCSVIHSDPKVPEFWKTVDSHFPDPRESSMHIKSHEWPVLLERVSSVLEGVKEGQHLGHLGDLGLQGGLHMAGVAQN